MNWNIMSKSRHDRFGGAITFQKSVLDQAILTIIQYVVCGLHCAISGKSWGLGSLEVGVVASGIESLWPKLASLKWRAQWTAYLMSLWRNNTCSLCLSTLNPVECAAFPRDTRWSTEMRVEAVLEWPRQSTSLLAKESSFHCQKGRHMIPGGQNIWSWIFSLKKPSLRMYMCVNGSYQDTSLATKLAKAVIFTPAPDQIKWWALWLAFDVKWHSLSLLGVCFAVLNYSFCRSGSLYALGPMKWILPLRSGSFIHGGWQLEPLWRRSWRRSGVAHVRRACFKATNIPLREGWKGSLQNDVTLQFLLRESEESQNASWHSGRSKHWKKQACY